LGLRQHWQRCHSNWPLFKKQIWIWPVIATILLSILAFTIRLSIEATMKKNLQSQLQTLLDVDTAMLGNWARSQTSIASSLANDVRIRESISTILSEKETASNRSDDRLRPVESETQKLLRKQLSPTMSSHAYVGFFVADKSQRVIASSPDEIIGKKDLPQHASFHARALKRRSDDLRSVCQHGDTQRRNGTKSKGGLFDRRPRHRILLKVNLGGKFIWLTRHLLPPFKLLLIQQ
jgi:hypothetical protein